jgi:hypothetical protein
MKKYILFILFSLSFNVINCQTNKTKLEPSGNWRFVTPYAPEGYQVGFMRFTGSENVYNVAISFTDTVNKLYGNNVKFENGNIDFIMYVEDQSINVSLKFAHPDTLKGRAFTSEGELPMTLMRKKD